MSNRQEIAAMRWEPGRAWSYMEKFGTIDKIMGAPVEELVSVEGIGPVLAKNIRAYFEEKL